MYTSVVNGCQHSLVRKILAPRGDASCRSALASESHSPLVRSVKHSKPEEFASPGEFQLVPESQTVPEERLLKQTLHFKTVVQASTERISTVNLPAFCANLLRRWRYKAPHGLLERFVKACIQRRSQSILSVLKPQSVKMR